MNKLFSIFEELMKINLSVGIVAVLIWVLNGKVNDSGFIHMTSVSLITTVLVVLIMMMVTLVVACLLKLINWLLTVN